MHLPGHGTQAQDLGWTDLVLFGMHPVIGTGRVDHCGALTLASKPAEWMDGTRINFGNTSYYRDKPSMPRGVPIWAFRA